MSSFQSGMDSVRNLTGSPIAGLDPHELLDVRPLLYKLNDVLFNKGRGNPEFANLPRKFNICISPSRDDFPHTQVSSWQCMISTQTYVFTQTLAGQLTFTMWRQHILIKKQASCQLFMGSGCMICNALRAWQRLILYCLTQRHACSACAAASDQ